jgi:hypothetical protein
MRRLFELEKENIKQKEQEDRRNRDLGKIFKLDRKLEQIMISKQQEELESLYPHGENTEGAFMPADSLTLNKSISDTSDGMSHNINGKVSTKDRNNQIFLNKFRT